MSRMKHFVGSLCFVLLVVSHLVVVTSCSSVVLSNFTVYLWYSATLYSSTVPLNTNRFESVYDVQCDIVINSSAHSQLISSTLLLSQFSQLAKWYDHLLFTSK